MELNSSWPHLPESNKCVRKSYDKGLITQQIAREDSSLVPNPMTKVESEKFSLKPQIKDIVMVPFCYNLNPYFPLIVKFLLYPNDLQTI